MTLQIAKEGEPETAGLQHRAAPGLPRFHEGDKNNSDPMSVGGFTYITETGRLRGQPAGAKSHSCLLYQLPQHPGEQGRVGRGACRKALSGVAPAHGPSGKL